MAELSLVVHGTIDGGEFSEADMTYCRATVVKGPDWKVSVQSGEKAAVADVVTQMCEKQPGPIPKYTWNTPFSFVLNSTNPFGWPQICLSLMTVDKVGEDRVVGYARCHVPMKPGRAVVRAEIISPMYSTPQHQLFGGMFGVNPELRDPAWLCSGEGREIMLASSYGGYINVSMDVNIAGLGNLGYD
jgi:B9 domain-containing protein 1